MINKSHDIHLADALLITFISEERTGGDDLGSSMSPDWESWELKR